MIEIILAMQLCQLEPFADSGWHYRTRIEPWPEAKCWYEGERMKPRKELYWAETPAKPMEVERPPWAKHAPDGWEHKE